MLLAPKNSVVARSADELPVDAIKILPPQIGTALGSDVSVIFPVFADFFPLTVAEIQRGWSIPAILAEPVSGKWLLSLFVENRRANIFFNNPYPIYAFTDYFDCPMIPDGWMPLYKTMSSFVLTPKESYSPVGWLNTPLSQSIDVAEVATELDISRNKFSLFQKRLGVRQRDKIRCWLMTDSKDSLWINEDACDKKVYHVRAGEFDDATEIADPSGCLDNYLSFFVSGGSPKDFDFRGG